MKLGRSKLSTSAIIVAATLAAGGGEAIAQKSIPPSLVTPDKVESRLGVLEFKDGAPSKATLEKVYDNLDFSHAFRAFEALTGRWNPPTVTRAQETVGQSAQ
jgi:hypothetical protein